MYQEAIQNYLNQHGHPRMQVQGVLFDMDGVLFDSMKNHAYSWTETMRHFGFQFEPYEAYLHEGRTGAGTINITSQRQRGHEATEEEIKEIYKYKADLFNSQPLADVMPGATQVLQQVQDSGMQPILVTGSGQASLLDRLNKHFPGVFVPERMVTAFDVKIGKPHPEPYLMGLEKGHLKANQAVVVENAPLGVQSAHAAGILTIAVNTGPLEDDILLDAGADLLFHSMQELADKWKELYPLLVG